MFTDINWSCEVCEAKVVEIESLVDESYPGHQHLPNRVWPWEFLLRPTELVPTFFPPILFASG